MKRVVVTLNELIYKHDLSINQLHLMTGIRRASLSELANGKRQRVQLEHIEKIANALEIDDINQIITIREEPDEDS